MNQRKVTKRPWGKILEGIGDLGVSGASQSARVEVAGGGVQGSSTNMETLEKESARAMDAKPQNKQTQSGQHRKHTRIQHCKVFEAWVIPDSCPEAPSL